jgi:hypothetical protein
MNEAIGYALGWGLMLTVCGGIYLGGRWIVRRIRRRK